MSRTEAATDAPEDPGSLRIEARIGRLGTTMLGLLSAQGLSWLATVISLPIVARTLGADGFGSVAIGWTVGAVLTIFCSVGTDTYLVRETARDPSASNIVVGRVIALRTLIWLPSAAIVSAVAFLFAGRDVWLPVAICSFGVGFSIVTTAFVSAFQGNFLIGRLAVRVAILGLGGVAATSVALLVFEAGAVAFLLVSTGWSIVPTIYLALEYRKLIGIPRVGSVWTLPMIARDCMAFWSRDLAFLLYTRVDILMLGFLASAAAIGNYALAYKLVSIPVFIPVVATAALFPELASLKRGPTFTAMLSRAVCVGTALMVPVSVAIAILAPTLVELVGNTSSYGAAIPLVVILAVHMPFVAISTLLSSALFALDQQRAWSVVAWTAAVVNPLLNFAAIPLAASLWDAPAAGAATTTLATELLMTSAAFWLIRTHLDWKLVQTSFIRTAVVGALGGGVMAATFWGWGPLAAVAAGGTSFTALLVGSRLISLTDLRLVLTQMAARRGAAVTGKPTGEPA